MTEKIGYHITRIPSGVLGETSKIQEELDELKDAEAQGCRVMELVELADLYGAIECYLQQKHPSITMADLAIFSSITKRAFTNGTRQSK